MSYRFLTSNALIAFLVLILVPAITVAWISQTRPIVSESAGLGFEPARRASLPPPASVPPNHDIVDAIESNADCDARTETLQSVADRIADSDLERALNRLVDDRRIAAGELAMILIGRWTALDPHAAAAWADRLAGKLIERPALEQIAITWTETDSVSAIAWLEKLPFNSHTDTVRRAMVYETARSDAFKAVELALSLADSPENRHVLAFALAQWASDNPASSIEWAASVADSALRESLFESLAIAIAGDDPRLAAMMVSRQLPVGEKQQRAAVAIVHRWKQADPSGAASWVDQFPDNTARRIAREILAEPVPDEGASDRP